MTLFKKSLDRGCLLRPLVIIFSLFIHPFFYVPCATSHLSLGHCRAGYIKGRQEDLPKTASQNAGG